MTRFLKLCALGSFALLAACSKPARFDDAAATGPLTAPPQVTIGDGESQVDEFGDPSSPSFFSQRVGDRVLFTVDQHTLNPDAQQVLRGQAVWLKTNSDYQALIEGHADEQGTTAYNLALSARRANAVKEFLTAQGVSASRLRTVPYGKERPAELCAEESCYRLNRRAVTVIAGGATS